MLDRQLSERSEFCLPNMALREIPSPLVILPAETAAPPLDALPPFRPPLPPMLLPKIVNLHKKKQQIAMTVIHYDGRLLYNIPR